MRKITRKGIVRKLDKLVSQIVIARDGKCIVCGTTKNLTCGHLFSRIAYSTRWDLENCYAQCLGCNFRHESDPYPMMLGVKAKFERDHPHISNSDTFIDNLHYKYVTPHKFKTFELVELFNDLSSKHN